MSKEFKLPRRWEIPELGLSINSHSTGWYVWQNGRPLETKDGKNWRRFKTMFGAAREMERIAENR